MADPNDTLLASVNTGAFILCVAFLGYVLLIIVPFLRRRPSPEADPSTFDWHFIVPCLNEELVIAPTVARLVTDFPGAHVWCVDDASSDTTPEILQHLARAHERVHVVTRTLPNAQDGKGAALNAAWWAIDAWLPGTVDRHDVIVGVLDADGWLAPGALHKLAGSQGFADPSVGAVQVQVRMVDHVAGVDAPGPGRSRTSRALVRLQDIEFASVIAAMQTLRRHIGSVGMGGNGQFTRLSVLDKIAVDHDSPWHGALLEDLELGLHVLLSGSRTEYCHDAYVAQQALPTVRQLVRQRSRWAQGSMQCLRYLVPVLRSPEISTAGAVEIAHFLLLPWFQLVGSLLYLVCGALMVWFALTMPGGPIAWFTGGAWGLVPLFLCFGLGPLVIWGPLYRARTDRRLSFGRSLLVGAANWPYTYVHQVAVWWAFGRVLRSRADWKKTRHAAPDVLLGPPTVRATTAAHAGRTVGRFRPRRSTTTTRPTGHIHLNPNPLAIENRSLSYAIQDPQ